jgi:hypothetical protein
MSRETPPWYEDDAPRPDNRPMYRNTVGSIVSWTLLRAVIYVLAAIFAFDYFRWVDYSLWWTVCVALFYAFVIYPMQVQYNHFRDETKSIVSGTLCSTCRHFEQTGILCLKLDEHVTDTYIPCDGQLWEPASSAPGGDE